MPRTNAIGSAVDSASIWSTFVACGASRGDLPAVIAPGREPLTFAQLPGVLVSIRDELASLGIGRDDRIAAVLPQGPETAVAFLAVAACAVYAPLNPAYTEAEFAVYLKRLKPKAILVQRGAAGCALAAAASLAIPVLELLPDVAQPGGMFSLRSLDSKPPGPAREAAWNGADDQALILLTSGTSAQPKLVQMRQRHLLAYARAGESHYGLGPGDRALHVMPMFHGHGLKSSLFVPLASGSGVIVPAEFDVRSFFGHMQALRPTWYSAAASIQRAILDRVDEFRGVARAADLRFIRSGSGRLDPKVMLGLEDAFGAPVLERYGMSETCTLTANPLPPGRRKPGSVGTPMFNEVAVIAEDGALLPAGITGEIVARGPGVFDGYFDDPEATAAAFLNGWFRTGDLGRFDEDGYLILAGRIKDVVNRGGEKIGTIEVEAALLRHPAVIEACVFAIPHPSLGEEVAAAVVLSGDAKVGERHLRGHARGLLTGFKVPRRIVALAALPKSATNKIRRDEVARLCAPLLAAPAAEAVAHSAPWSALEREVAQLWQRALGAPAGIDRDDDFFLLGGDSLKAYELFDALRRRYGIAIGLRHLFDDAATVAGMARMIDRSRLAPPRSRSSVPRFVPIKEDGDRPPLFAIPGSGGNPVGFVHLGRLLDHRQPLIGIEARGIDGLSRPLSRVEDIAADNLAGIRALQTRGPYFLTGACYGARVAYEMARQLEAAGEQVGLLIMLDPSSPFHRADGQLRGDAGADRQIDQRHAVVRLLIDRIALYASSLARLHGAERVAFVREKAQTLRDILRKRDLFRGDRSELHQRLVYAANRAAGGRYVPGTYAGPVVICFTRDRPIRGERNYRLDWLQLLPQSGGARQVSGDDSGAMLNLPHVYELAILVNLWLGAAQAGVGVAGAAKATATPAAGHPLTAMAR